MEIEVVKLNNKKSGLESFLINQHREVVLECEDLYPGIDLWYDRKAKPGIEKGERIGYLVRRNGKPVGAAIARHGEDAKICTIRVKEEAMHEGIGKILFLLLALNLRRETKFVHFTVPEHLWNNYNTFFTEMGFVSLGYAHEQYRLWDSEIAARAPYHDFQDKVYELYLPQYAKYLTEIGGNKVDLIVSVKPEYAKRIANKTKTVELRKKFSKKWIGRWALIYSSAPDQAFIATAKIEDVVKDNPISVWLNWKEAIDCSEEDYYNYTNGSPEIFGIILGEVTRIDPISKSQLEYLLHNNLMPPQSYCEINKSPLWEAAVGISHLIRKNI